MAGEPETSPPMVAAGIVPPETEPSRRRRWVIRGAVVSLLALIAVVALQPDLRGLLSDTGREMLAIHPALLAAIIALKVLQALLSSLSWRNALRAAWPEADLSYRFVLGVDQGQDVVNTVIPARFGTWGMLAILDLSIPRAHISTLLAAWGVQNLAYLLFAGIVSAIVAVGLPTQSEEGSGVTHRVAGLATDRPLLAAGIAVVLVAVIAFVAVRGRHRLAALRQQIALGIAILRTPQRYLRLMFLPSLASYVCRIAAYMLLLGAFDIPVTLWTVALALGSNAVAGAVRITPGGLGTTQALDVVALRGYAPADVVTAYSLAELAITAVVSAGVAVVALVSVSGWRGACAMFTHLQRGDVSRGWHAVGERQRALRQRATHRRPRGDGANRP